MLAPSAPEAAQGISRNKRALSATYHNDLVGDGVDRGGRNERHAAFTAVLSREILRAGALLTDSGRATSLCSRLGGAHERSCPLLC